MHKKQNDLQLVASICSTSIRILSTFLYHTLHSHLFYRVAIPTGDFAPRLYAEMTSHCLSLPVAHRHISSESSCYWSRRHGRISGELCGVTGTPESCSTPRDASQAWGLARFIDSFHVHLVDSSLGLWSSGSQV
jgi:hypothetical protein